MGGSYTNNKGNGGNRVKPIGLMLVVAFGAALLGVMLLHKLRDRRIFNLLLKEKDRDLISLQLLFQKQRELGKEMKRKNEEMQAKILALRTQKAALDSTISEMHSTIASLKDEQRSMTLALEEKRNEIKLLREKEGDSEKEDTQLAERLKQKEAEIEDLRRRLQVPVQVLSVSTDDPSNPAANTTILALSAGEKDKKDENQQESESLSESESLKDKDQSTNKDTENVTVREPARENATRVEDREAGGDFSGEGKSVANVTETGIEVGDSVENTRDKSSDVKTSNGEEQELAGEILQKKDGDSRDGDVQDQETQAASKGAMKLEIQDNAGHGSGPRGKGSRSKGKRWRTYARHRRLERNGNSERDEVGSAKRLRSRRLYKEAPRTEISKSQGEDESILKTGNESGLENKPQISESRQEPRSREAVHSPEAESQNPEVTEHQKDQAANTVEELQAKKEDETEKISSPNGEATEEINLDKDAEGVKVGEEHENKEEDPEVAEKTLQKTNAANEDFKEPGSNPDEENTEEYEEIDESEF